MRHLFSAALFLLLSSDSVHSQKDYTDCFENNLNIPGADESTRFSFGRRRHVDRVCRNNRHCREGFKCVPTTARLSRSDKKGDTLPSFCQAPPPPPPTSRSSVTAVFIPTSCKCLIDLVYVIDKSGSMGTTRFQHQIKFLKDLTNSISASQPHRFCVKFAIASFSSGASGHQSLTYSASTIISKLNTILNAGSGGGSSVHLGMNLGNNYFGTSGDRYYAPNVMLVTTDLIYGSTSFINTIKAASQTIRNSGTCIHAVGMNTPSSPSLVVLQAITGNQGLVNYRRQHLLSQIINTVHKKLCGDCSPCDCPRGFKEHKGRCYRNAGPACWFYGDGICHQLGATFTSNWDAAITIGGSSAWYRHPNAPILVNMFPFCMTPTQCVGCCAERRIVCERPCLGKYATAKQVRELAAKSPKDEDKTSGRKTLRSG